MFTLKMGTIQTGLLVGFGHRPLNKFPLKQGENNEGNHSLPEAERTVFIHITENGNVAGEADDGEARQKRQEAASAPVLQNPQLRLDPCSMNALQPQSPQSRQRHACAVVHECGHSPGSAPTAHTGLLAPPTQVKRCDARSLGCTCTCDRGVTHL